MNKFDFIVTGKTQIMPEIKAPEVKSGINFSERRFHFNRDSEFHAITINKALLIKEEILERIDTVALELAMNGQCSLITSGAGVHIIDPELCKINIPNMPTLEELRGDDVYSS